MSKELEKKKNTPGTKSEDPSPEAKVAATVASSVPSRRSQIHEGDVFFPQEIIKDLSTSERFRILRAKIERLNLLQDNYHVLAVTSAIQSEGKSVVSANLARALSLDPVGKTLLIDCDLRRPNVHNFFDIPRRPGLTDAIYRNVPIDVLVNSVSPGLDVLTAGSELIDPAQGIERPEFSALIAEARIRYRYVLIDCPPVLICPEPITISLIVDSTILVVRAWHTAKNLIKEAIEAIGKHRILGTVLNDGDDITKDYLDYGYYDYRLNRSKAKDKTSEKPAKTAPTET